MMKVLRFYSLYQILESLSARIYRTLLSSKIKKKGEEEEKLYKKNKSCFCSG